VPVVAAAAWAALRAVNDLEQATVCLLSDVARLLSRPSLCAWVARIAVTRRVSEK
jgi:hypothetical protein